MKQLNLQQIEKAQILKACRVAIRLKYSLLADKELNQRLSELEKRLDAALLKGKPLKITTAELLGNV